MLEKLTPRELEILSLIAQGFSNKEICNEKLHIAISTLRAHIHRIYDKMGFTERSKGDALRVNAVLIYQKEKENLKLT